MESCGRCATRPTPVTTKAESNFQFRCYRNPYSGALFVCRGRRGDLIKALHWDGQGLCLYAKPLELSRARFVWPQTDSGTVTLTAAQVSMLLKEIDWRMPAWTARPEVAV